MITKEEALVIKNNNDLEYLIYRFKEGPPFAMAFVFDNDDLYNKFFEDVNISVELFQENYCYFDRDKNIHISESEFGFVWISTMGLVPTSKPTKNNFVNAFLCQKTVLNHLLDDATQVCNNNSVYDIDSSCYQAIEELTLALFHNLIFFSETLLKAYISLLGGNVPHTHKLEELLKNTKEIMYEKKHNDTLFHAYVIPVIEGEVMHISSIPGKFKEEYVKYDDNPNDTTIVVFSSKHFDQLRDFVNLSDDIIMSLYYNPNDQKYFEQGLYERLYEKCTTEKAKNAIEKVYKFLVKQKDDQN